MDIVQKFSHLCSDVAAKSESCGRLGILAGDRVNVRNVQLQNNSRRDVL